MGSMERQLRRRQQSGSISAASAVDLDQFRGGDRAAQQEIADRMLTEQGWMCQCGGRFRSEAIVAVGYNLGRYPEMQMTPAGPRPEFVDGAQVFTQAFCSKSCKDYVDALKNGFAVPEGSGMARARIVAVRRLPVTEWLDDGATTPFHLPA